MKLLVLAACAVAVCAKPSSHLASLQLYATKNSGNPPSYIQPKKAHFRLKSQALAGGKGAASKPETRGAAIKSPATARSSLECGSHSLEAGTYNVQSVNYPSDYANNHDCEYSISASDGSDVHFECSSFLVEPQSSCGWDYLEVNGQKYCGTNGPDAASYSTLSLHFHTDSSVVKKGFSCSLVVTAAGGSEENCNLLDCGVHNLDEGTYSIESPNHPDNYDNSHECSYQLNANNADHSLSITCDSFDVERHSSCGYDWLSVNGDKFCGTTGPQSVSTASSMQLEFHTDSSVVRSGYQCHVTVSVDANGGGGGGVGDCCCGVPNRVSRIVGGVETEQHEYPWQVALVEAGDSTEPLCGGSLINSRYVLTAAHCVHNRQPDQLDALMRLHVATAAGSVNALRVPLAEILLHPQFSTTTLSHDVALLKLDEPVSFDSSDNQLAPVCLPDVSAQQFVGADAIASGWGATSEGGQYPDALREVTVPIISNSECRDALGDSIDASMLCAGVSEGGLDACQGDSGGPLVTLAADRYSLVGVVSWGNGCARPNSPGVYARVTSVRQWITDNTRDATYCR